MTDLELEYYDAQCALSHARAYGDRDEERAALRRLKLARKRLGR